MSQIHICTSYRVKPGWCFVDDKRLDWRRTRLVWVAKKDKRKIIRCARCRRPATWLDHFYPWMSDMNRCDKCAEKKGN